MIKLYFPEMEYYNEAYNLFETKESLVAEFEYSLVAISKWESKWKVPYMTSELAKDDPRLIDFLLCMTDCEELTIDRITSDHVERLTEYIGDSHTATKFSSRQNEASHRAKTYTAEEIYALMFMNHVPLELERRNLNNLMVVLRIISHYNTPPEKMSKQDILSQNALLNAQRKAKLNTKG